MICLLIFAISLDLNNDWVFIFFSISSCDDEEDEWFKVVFFLLFIGLGPVGSILRNFGISALAIVSFVNFDKISIVWLFSIALTMAEISSPVSLLCVWT